MKTEYIYFSDEQSEAFCLKGDHELNSINNGNVGDKYPFLRLIPESVFSKYDYLLRNGLLKYKNGNFDLVEIITKSNKKYYFQKKEELIQFNDFVVIKIEDDSHLARVTDFLGESEYADYCYIKKCNDIEVMRIATDSDLTFFNNKYQEEERCKEQTIEVVERYGFDMKINDVAWQSDRQKLTIFFTAPHRIDFREMVKDLAKIFKTRIELRQISAREEAKRLGAFLGPCGRDLCCTSFLNNFEHITLDHAKIQQLSHNLTKLTGNCGRLKCCLKYEYDVYSQIYEKIVPVGTIIYMKDKVLKVKKLDIPNELAVVNDEANNKPINVTFNELQSYIKEGRVVKPVHLIEEPINKSELAIIEG